MSVDIAARIAEWCSQLPKSAGGTRVTPAAIRRWLREYLASVESELRRFPDLAARPHWDMVVWEDDPGGDAPFTAVRFDGSVVQLLAGHGAAPRLRAFGDSQFPSDPRAVLSALAGQFETTPELTLSRVDLDEWLASKPRTKRRH